MDAIISVDENFEITLFNQGAEAIFGHRREDVLGQPLDMLLPERFRKAHLGEVSAFGLGRIIIMQPDTARVARVRTSRAHFFMAEISRMEGS